MAPPRDPVRLPFYLKEKDWQPPPADWGAWVLQFKGELWEAVVLSLGFEPDCFRLSPDFEEQLERLHGPGSIEPPPTLALTRTIPSERRRIENFLRNAESHLGEMLPVVQWANPRFASTVRFRDFATWAEGLGVSLPPPFPRLGPKEADPKPGAADDAKALGTRERQSMQKVIAVLSHAANFAIEQPLKDADRIVASAAELGITITRNTVADILKGARVHLPKKDSG